MLDREARRKAAEERIRQNKERADRTQKDGKPRGIFDFSKVGGYKEDMFFKSPKESKWLYFDIIPFLVKNENYPYKGRIGQPDYVLDLWVHRFVGQDGKYFIICPQENYGLPCPICEDRKMQQASGASNKEIKKLKPDHRCFYNIINLQDIPPEKQKVQIWEEAHHLFERHLLAASTQRGGGFIPFFEIEMGSSIECQAKFKPPTFNAKENRREGNYCDYEGIKFVERKPYDKSIYDQVYPLDQMMILLSYDEIYNIHYGIDAEVEKPEATPQEKAPEPASVRVGRGGVQETHTEPDRSPRRVSRSAPVEEPRHPRRDEPMCPYGHKIGADNMVFHEDCNKCDADIFEKCQEIFENLPAEG